MKDLLVFIASYCGLYLLYTLIFIGVVILLIFLALKWLMNMNMNEEKWDAFFKYKKGQRIYTILIIAYSISISLIFLLGLAWFRWINYKKPALTALVIAGIMITMGLFKFVQVKQLIESKYEAYFN